VTILGSITRLVSPYNEARVATLENLIALRDRGLIRMQDPVSPDVLARIREGVSKSTRISFKYVELLLDQGVIE
jgi:hypothetical protein